MSDATDPQVRRLEREIKRLRHELQQATASLPHLRQMVQASDDLLILVGPGCRIIEANQRLADALGVLHAQLYGQSLCRWLVNPGQIQVLEQRLEAMAAEAVITMELDLESDCGTAQAMEAVARRLAVEPQGEPRWVLALRACSQQRRLQASAAARQVQSVLLQSVQASESKVEEMARKYQTLFDQSLDGLCLMDPEGHLLEVNQAALNLFGETDRRVFMRLTPADLSPDVQPDGVSSAQLIEQMIHRALVDGSCETEFLHRHLRSGAEWLGLVSLRRLELAEGVRLLARVRDISEARRSENRLRSLAYEDQLTALPNAAAVTEWLQERLQRRPAPALALIWLDLDGFRRVNHSIGHEAGDAVLQAAAAALRSARPAADLVARLAGDEFLVVSELESGLSDPDTLQGQAEAIVADLRQAFADIVVQTDDVPLRLTFTAGMSLAPSHGTSAEVLLQASATALSRAREIASGQALAYQPAFTERLRRDMALEASLAKAVDSGDLRLFYQPQVDGQGRLVGAEALVRWNDPFHGPVPPARFIAVAERTGLIQQLGHWVLEQACAQLRDWIDQGLTPPRLAVNLSPRQFELTLPSLLDQVATLLSRYQLSPSQLELEITETCIMPKFGAVSQVQQLAAKGLTLALDDFGTGYSSLSTLYRLSLHKLKIDRAFVKELEVSFDARTIVRTALSMGRGLGLETLAEGVETAGQLEVLELLGCDTYQGFLFHRPMEAEAFADLLRQRRSTREDGADAGVPDVP